MTGVENLNQAPAALSLCQAPGATTGTVLVTGDGNRYIFDSESPFQVGLILYPGYHGDIPDLPRHQSQVSSVLTLQ